MDLSLINVELSESKLYRSTSSFGKLTGPDIASLLYLNTLSVVMLNKDLNQHEYGKKYAEQTAKHGFYTFFKSSSTDLYMLAFQVNNPENTSTKASEEARNYLGKLRFNNRQHFNVMKKIGEGRIDDNTLTVFFLALERQLKIGPKYTQWRRQVLNWDGVTTYQREATTKAILRELKMLNYNSELGRTLGTMVSYKQFVSINEPKPEEKPKPSTAKRVAATAAGAVAGRHVGKKVAQKLGKDETKYKKAGTGLGAIAGYWASGARGRKT